MMLAYGCNSLVAWRAGMRNLVAFLLPWPFALPIVDAILEADRELDRLFAYAERYGRCKAFPGNPTAPSPLSKS